MSPKQLCGFKCDAAAVLVWGTVVDHLSVHPGMLSVTPSAGLPGQPEHSDQSVKNLYECMPLATVMFMC